MSTGPASQETLALIWSGVAPQFVALEPQADAWVLGRDTAGIDDERVSRRHCQVTRVDEGWQFVDLGSANGTFVDGQRVDGTLVRPRWEVLMLGRSLITPLRPAPGVALQVVEVEGGFVGPGLAPAWDAVAEVGQRGAHLMLVGAPGSGLAALVRHYARSCGRAGERFSVVSSTEGLAPEDASELPAGVLYVADPRILQGWADDPWIRAVLAREDLRVCAGLELHRDRESPWPAPPGFVRVDVPPLAARFEELPRRIERLIHASEPQMEIDVTLVEACFLYDWSGGIGELERACGEALAAAQRAGKPRVTVHELRSFVADPDVMATLRGEPPRHPFAGKTPLQPRQAVRGLREPGYLAYLLDVCGGDPEQVASRLGASREAVEQWARHHGLVRDR